MAKGSRVSSLRQAKINNRKQNDIFGDDVEKFKLWNGDTNVLKNGKRVGLITGSTTYVYDGVVGGIKVGQSIDGGKYYVTNLNKSVDTNGWTVRSIAVMKSRTVVHLVNPNDTKMSASIDLDDIKKKK